MSSSQNNHSHYDKEVKDFIRRNPWLCYFFPWQTDDMTLEVAYRSWIDNLNDWIRKNDPKDPPNSEWYTDADQRAAYCRFCYRNGEKRLLTPIGRDSGLVRLQIGNTNKHFANTQKHHGNISQLYNSTKKDITLAAIQECTVALFLKTPTVPFEFFDQPEWEKNFSIRDRKPLFEIIISKHARHYLNGGTNKLIRQGSPTWLENGLQQCHLLLSQKVHGQQLVQSTQI
mmetsp:Transcript_2262/g.3238  ORF Transcript_2262/g.3238 Transcript_2262/m.3238 type:complete len:228 (+) Transcript_2262:69-752(+)